MAKPQLVQQIERRCTFFYECQKSEVYNDIKWNEHWRKFNDKFICSKHYSRLISNPKRVYEDRKEKQREYNKIHNPITNPIYSKRDLTYKDRRIQLKENPRKGYCTWCSNNIHDKSCKRTGMHHIVYVPIFVWFATIELCASCHSKETQRLLKLGVHP